MADNNGSGQQPTQGQALSLISVLPTLAVALMTPLVSMFDFKMSATNNFLLLVIVGTVACGIVFTTAGCIYKVLRKDSIPPKQKNVGAEKEKVN